MKAGQRVARWWKRYFKGAFRSPQDLVAAARAEQQDNAQAWMRFVTEYKDTPNWDVPARLSAPSWFGPTDAMLRQWYKADYQHADTRLMLFAAIFQELARRHKVPLYVHCCFRTEAEQNALLAAGHSKVAYPKSAHNIGEAVDIVHSVYHWSMTDLEWRFIGLIGREAERLANGRLPPKHKFTLNWGGDDGPGDKFRWDPAHWEMADYRHRTRRLTVGDPVRFTPRGILARGF